MRVFDDIHDWNVDPREAVALQRKLVVKLSPGRLLPGVLFVAGVDVSVLGSDMASSVVVYSIRDRRLVECVSERRPVDFPYVPGLLSFREGPAILAALRGITTRVDMIMFDGHGIAHPRGLGIAAHIGLWVDVPTIGVAKSVLVGQHRPPGGRAGSRATMNFNGVKIGFALRTRDNVKPVYVSPGNRIGFEGAMTITERCCAGYRLPEPVRLAHTAAALARQLMPDAAITQAINSMLAKRDRSDRR